MRYVSSSCRRILGASSAFVGFVAASALAGILITATVTPVVAVAAVATEDSTSAFNSLPDYLKIQPLDQTTTFYATKGHKQVPIATFYAQNRIGVAWDDVSQYVKDGAIATEDPRFYSEGGIDIIGTMRAAIANATDKPVQGGSSITQQYVKNVRVMKCDAMPYNADASKKVREAQKEAVNKCDNEASGTTISRKVQEMRYAIGVNQSYTKSQILLGYLNISGFGGRVYGVEAAARYYYGATAKTVTLPQAATLVAMVNNPANLRIDQTKKVNPDNNADNKFAKTLERRNYVLTQMLKTGKVTNAQYEKAVKTPITPHIHPVQSGCTSASSVKAGFFCDYVRHVLLQNPIFGKTADDRTSLFDLGGLKVYTTLNLDLEKSAYAGVSAYIPAAQPGMSLGASNVDVEVGTGRIVSMVENKNFDESAGAPPSSTALNFNTDSDYGGSAGFQTGSSFKAFDLIAWLEAGHTLGDSVNANVHSFPFSDFAASCTDTGFDTWSVSNDESSEGGYMSVLRATEASVNTAFAMLGTSLDLCNISHAATALDVHSASPDHNPWSIVPSMILGTNYIAPLSMATAYAGIANNGKVCTPVAIDKVINPDGSEHAVPKTACTQGLPSNIAAAVVYALQHVMTNGTAVSANPNDGVPIMGKTGTTDNSLQNWLVTSTTKVATATWVGNIEGGVPLRSQVFKGINGGNVKFFVAKPILAAMNKAYGGGEFTTPESSLLYVPRPVAPPKPKPTASPKAPKPAPGESGPGSGSPGSPGKGTDSGSGSHSGSGSGSGTGAGTGSGTGADPGSGNQNNPGNGKGNGGGG